MHDGDSLRFRQGAMSTPQKTGHSPLYNHVRMSCHKHSSDSMTRCVGGPMAGWPWLTALFLAS